MTEEQLTPTDNISCSNHVQHGETPAQSAQRPSRLRRLIFAVIAIALALSILEIAVRVLNVGRPTFLARRMEPPGFMPVRYQPPGYNAYVPNISFSFLYDPAGDSRGYFGPDGEVVYKINNLGLRGPDTERKKPPGRFRVLCIGDSFTFGEGVHQQDTYPAVLERLLSKSMNTRDVEVLNAGTQGYATKHAGAAFYRRGIYFSPDVVTLGFVLNDATDDETTIRQHEDRIHATDPTPILGHSRLWSMTQRAWRGWRTQREYFRTTRQSFASNEWDICRSTLQGLETLSRNEGFRFVVVLFPLFYDLEGNYPFEDIHKQVAATCREFDIEFIDLLDAYRGMETESLWVHPTDQHPNEIAHKIAAKRLAEYLLKDAP